MQGKFPHLQIVYSTDQNSIFIHDFYMHFVQFLFCFSMFIPSAICYDEISADICTRVVL